MGYGFADPWLTANLFIQSGGSLQCALPFEEFKHEIPPRVSLPRTTGDLTGTAFVVPATEASIMEGDLAGAGLEFDVVAAGALSVIVVKGSARLEEPRHWTGSRLVRDTSGGRAPRVHGGPGGTSG